MKRQNTLIVTFIGLAVLAAALTSASAATPKENWDKTCSKCHGPDGKGDTKAGKMVEVKDFTDAKYQASLKDDTMFKSVKEGKQDGDKVKMKPAEGLTDDEIKALVSFVRAFKK
jgi:cytochrome c553